MWMSTQAHSMSLHGHPHMPAQCPAPPAGGPRASASVLQPILSLHWKCSARQGNGGHLSVLGTHVLLFLVLLRFMQDGAAVLKPSSAGPYPVPPNLLLSRDTVPPRSHPYVSCGSHPTALGNSFQTTLFPHFNTPPTSPTLLDIGQENKLLKETIQEATQAVGLLEEGLSRAGVTVPAASTVVAAFGGKLVPEDFWSPSIDLPGGIGPFADEYGTLQSIPNHNGTDCFRWDKTLWSQEAHFKYRWDLFKKVRKAIEDNEGGLQKFAQGYQHYGLNRGTREGKAGLWYREWAPGAKALALIGEFNEWSPKAEHWAVKGPFGVFELFLPDGRDGRPAVPHKSKLKCRLETPAGAWVERIPAWIKWATQEWNEIQYNGVHWEPEDRGAPGEVDVDKSYTFKYPRPPKPRSLRIYECHVGMSSAEPKINSYLEFRRDMLGYNAVQIMAIQEHAYYGSFGYHVTNFFAVQVYYSSHLTLFFAEDLGNASSRFGTPEELKALIDEAHRLGLVVFMDVVHSHASKNTVDGINMFDGTDAMYFHSGERGNHWMWDSRLFNYGNWETMRFLLSNARWWLDEYKFDGFRFDGVTSMMYKHHGLSTTFTGNYNEYFGMATDADAVVYLMLVNNLLHDTFPSCITIGEDVSGMPAFCRPWQEGGVGFDYRLQMAIADKWIQVLKTKSDYEWDMGDIVHTLTNRRYSELCVGYAESHDQALVGDKTIAFWLMDKDMYDCMAAPGFGPQSPVVDRGIALHKMIRQVTMVLGGESYLNFMGNEFGHPEWIDFPRVDTYDTSTGAFIPGNGGSLEKCRRRWDICDNPQLRYKNMNAYDRAMIHLDKAFGYISAPHQWVSRQDNSDKLLVCERGDLVFVFNFHPTNSYTDYRIGCKLPGDYKVVLSSDEEVFGGYRNVTKDSDVLFRSSPGNHDKRPHWFQVYAPSRTVVAYAPVEFADKDADRKPHGIPGLGVLGLGPYYAR